MTAIRIVVFCTVFLFHISISAQIITTVAGDGSYEGYAGDGGPATQARLAWPNGIAVDNMGNLFIADMDNNIIRKVDATGIITTYAGIPGTYGYSGDGGPATAAKLYHPDRLSFDNLGNLIVVDQNAAAIRKITPAGIITSLCPPNYTGFSGDGGPLTSAQFNLISAVAFDNAGNMYIADYGSDRIRKVNTSGIINTIVGTGATGYSGDGGLAINAALKRPQCVLVDAFGNLLITDAGNHCIRKVDPSGIITTYAGNGTQGYSGDGGAAVNAQMNSPWFSALDNAGNLYISDALNNVVRKVDPSGIITTYAGNGSGIYSGDGGLATQAGMPEPTGVCADALGNVYVVNRTPVNVVRKVSNCLAAILSKAPVDTILCSSGNPSFSISATNYLSLQWQVNPGTGWNNVTDDGTYNGSATNTLSIIGANSLLNNYKYRCLMTNGCGIISTPVATLKVTSTATPSVNISASSNTICSGSTVNFNATAVNGGSFPSYIWQKNGLNVGNNSPSFSGNSLANGDIISCLLTSSESCITSATASSNSIAMTVNPNLTPGITIASSNNNICFGTPVTFTSTITNGGTAPTYQWSKNGSVVSSNFSYSDNSLNNADVVQCTLKSNYGCLTTPSVISNQVRLNVIPLVTPAVSITSSVAAICPESPISFSANAVNGGTSPSYHWMKNGLNVGVNSSVYSDNSFSNGDVVKCKMTSNGTCLANPNAISAPIAIKVYQNPVVSLDHNSTLCSGSTRQLDAGNYPSYLWNNGNTGRYLNVSGTGNYFVSVTDNNGCKGSDTVKITSILPQPSNFLSQDTSICSYGSLIIKPNQTFNTYLWSSGGSAPNITITAPGTYWLQVKDNNQCLGKDSIVISAKECMKGIYVPSAFSPNGDGKNDAFRPLLFGKVKQFTFTIYNRWGQIIFQTKELQKGWNGMTAGTQQQGNVFVWICYYQLENEQPKVEKGTVVLIR
jgi:gliding motility-associated-like protein